MDTLRINGFGGMSGRVLREATSPGSLLTGFLVLGAMWLADWMIGKTDPTLPTSPVLQVLWALALARFALNGYFGEWGGTVLSSSGGSWGSVFAVTSRYVTLTAIWLVPMLLLKASPSRVGEVVGSAMFGEGDTMMTFLVTLYVTISVLSPPLFLIVSVGASSFGEIFSPTHWSRLFSGRKGDLFTIYCLYTGSVALFALLAMPLFILTGLKNVDLALFLGMIMGMYAGGFAATLLGRLCGFFAAYESPEGDSRSGDPQGPPPDSLDIAPADPVTARPQALSIVEAQTSPTQGGANDAIAARRTAPTEPMTPRLGVVGADRPAGSIRPPLLDARERVNEISERFEQDPGATITALEDLARRFAEHPLVLHALCLLKDKAGDRNGSFQAAKQAMPLFLSRGNLRLAAEVFHIHVDRASALDLDRDAVMEMGDQLRQLRLFGSASSAYTLILEHDATETRAVKGMLQVAEAHLHHHNEPAEARRIYEFLIERCPHSPLAEFMHQGLTEAERRSAANG